MTDLLPDVLRERLDALDVPSGDLVAVVREGVARRRRRQRVRAGIAAAAAVAVVGGGLAVLGGADGDAGRGSDFAGVGALDLGDGLRAYADPGVTIHLGGRSFPAGDLDFLDTDAAATPFGVVFFEQGRPFLLGEDGRSEPLVDGPVEAVKDFHPTAKVDSAGPLVAWATATDGVTTLTVRDLETGDDVASTEVDCDGSCADLVVDALDQGVVFVRDGGGTRTFDSATGEWADFAGRRTRVADVRNGVVLYDGPAPTGSGWRLVKGAIDSQLTFDGRYLVAWSARLLPTEPGGSAILLDVPGRDGALSFLTVDTDGSVLVASAVDYPDFTVYDCVLPSGACTSLGPLSTTGGDPLFIGNDM